MKLCDLCDRIHSDGYCTAATPEPATEALVDDEWVELAAEAYAEATGYYVPFHRGLSSPSADKIRTGVRAALKAALHKGGA